MAQRSRRQRKDLMQGAALAGSSSRSGPDDPRHRRGAQAEMAVEQRFDPDDFEVDDQQRVKAKEKPVSAVIGVACLLLDPKTLTTSYATVGLQLPTTELDTSGLISVATTSDVVGLYPGHAYRVDVEMHLENTASPNQRTGYFRIIDAASVVYAQRSMRLGGAIGTVQATGCTSAVIDLRSALDKLLISFVAKESADGLRVLNGWVTIQRVG